MKKLEKKLWETTSMISHILVLNLIIKASFLRLFTTEILNYNCYIIQEQTFTAHQMFKIKYEKIAESKKFKALQFTPSIPTEPTNTQSITH